MKKLFTAAILAGMLLLSSCGSSNAPTPTETPIPTATVTLAPTPEPTVAVTKDPEEVARKAKEYDVYEYIQGLFDSSENPSNWSDIGSDVAVWQKKVEEYEDNVMKKAAAKFEISVEEAENIYLKVVGGY